ncbi:MAG: Hsp20/alpha crystallin family protein [Prochloraceae cyanobacterium]|nr:Hsp20/alpha crystallin family protein [Prochloraceae cyanobacterium]
MAIIRRDQEREIERWEPLGEMFSWHRRMNRLFERLMPRADRFKGLDFMPAAEMDETEDEIHLKLEIPGMEASDLDIEVSETSIAIGGERKSESKTEERGMVRSELSYGQFERVIPLPAHIQNDKVKAEYKNGILTLTLPKTEEEKHKTVKVEVA